jgi:alkylated DNA repair dioxygenase AlkB
LTPGPERANIEQVSANVRSPEVSELLADLHLQGSLFGTTEPNVDEAFNGLRRIDLDARSWLDHLPGWLAGEQTVFDHLLENLAWRQRTVTMWERRLPEPRLTSWWTPEQGPEALPILATMRRVLSARYAEAFDSIGFNCYRHGEDSVAWHGDRHRRTIDDPIVAIVSVGAPRPLRIRPRGGGTARSFDLGRGDLFVMGGACQHDWEHGVPKVRTAEPRISITYRHGAR